MTPPPVTEASPNAATHYCVVCAARWINHPDGSWSLASNDCGPCCDNVPMDRAPIIKILPDGSVGSRDHERARRAYDSARRLAEVDRYRGILCALCDEPFERHGNDWSCQRRIAARFKFPAALAARSNQEATPDVELRKALLAAQPYLDALLRSVEAVDVEVLGKAGGNVALHAVIDQVAAALTTPVQEATRTVGDAEERFKNYVAMSPAFYPHTDLHGRLHDSEWDALLWCAQAALTTKGDGRDQ